MTFLVSTGRAAPLAVWETPLAGWFSEAAVTLHPCTPLRVVFTGEAAVAAQELEGTLELSSLHDHQQFSQ